MRLATRCVAAIAAPNIGRARFNRRSATKLHNAVLRGLKATATVIPSLRDEELVPATREIAWIDDTKTKLIKVALDQIASGWRPVYVVQSSTESPSIRAKSVSRLTSATPRCRATAAIQRSFSSSERPFLLAVQFNFGVVIANHFDDWNAGNGSEQPGRFRGKIPTPLAFRQSAKAVKNFSPNNRADAERLGGWERREPRLHLKMLAHQIAERSGVQQIEHRLSFVV
jgi:hypothetical protein